MEWLGQQENPAGKGWAAEAGHGTKILSILKAITVTSGGASSAEVWYRVRKTWADAASQKGAFHSLDNAKRCADENAGYSVFDESGKALYTSQTPDEWLRYAVERLEADGDLLRLDSQI